MHRTKIVTSFFKSGNSKYYGSWSKTDLPILPRVAFAHKKIKQALLKHEDVIPEKFSRELRENLDEIRSINWNYYNTDGIDLIEAQKVKMKLQKLIDFENKLPEPLASELGVLVFESLKGAIDCLNERSGSVYGKPYPQ